MKDILDELAAVQRGLGRAAIPAGDAATVTLKRSYPADIEDVWDAITDPERLNRWFMPVTGELKVGGRYQLVGNAGGEILHCEPPRHLKVTWVYGENPKPTDVSEVTVRLSPEAGGATTAFELVHAAVVDPKMDEEYGPGAVGVGWDLALLGIALYLSGGGLTPEERAAFDASPEGREFATRSSEAWGTAMLDSGWDPEDTARRVANTTAFYVPPQAP
ncbi:SRPBCC family protein [Phytohabitans aurantiacus]|uniref:Activator of HSP90 ATPase n=1 Tax=Phytohabitans aurantiacus TaxID=3016789 RepID=A0ABQ5R5L6_9ACTN|nr:SRPBCC family protein [Phytohabitans aurantiacus]GLI01648.1 activator of HSP90 ATPase [Phytohabitans aurantiacus]